MKLIATTLLHMALTVPALAATSGGLAPCDSSDSYHLQVAAAIDQQAAGTLLLGFTAYPSFQSEWGIRIVQDAKNAVMLRVVEFRDSVWSSAYQEEPKGSFKRNPAKANLQRSIRDIVISDELLRELRRVVEREVGAASAANAKFGLDGETYAFTSGANACAETWSPESGTRMAKLVAIFAALRTLPNTPTNPLRSFHEMIVIGKLKKL